MLGQFGIINALCLLLFTDRAYTVVFKGAHLFYTSGYGVCALVIYTAANTVQENSFFLFDIVGKKQTPSCNRV